MSQNPAPRGDFNPETFTGQFEAFLDALMPADDAVVGIEEMTAILRCVREYCDEQHAPMDYQLRLIERIVHPWLTTTAATAAERAEMLRKWAAAIGADITLPH